MRRAVAKVELPYVQAFKDRHGRLRHYYRRPGFKRVPLPGAPGSAEFMAAYAACHERASPPTPQERVQPRSINALIVEYYRSAEWAELRDSTKIGYRNHLDRFRAKHGAKGAASIQPHHLEAIFHGMAATPGAAKNLRKRLRRVFRLAVRLGWRTDNPVTETEAPRRKTEGFTPWSEEEIDAYEKHWPSGSRERLALALLLYTGQRRSDVVGMGRQHVTGDRISVRQLKTNTRLKIKLHEALRTEIAAAPANMTFLVTQYGAPFTAAGFTQWFRERAEMAGVMNRTPHGLRKAAGRRLAEAGCTAKQIAAVLGHATLSEVERYTRDADQEALADEAVDRLQGLTVDRKPNRRKGRSESV
jgi:integrase